MELSWNLVSHIVCVIVSNCVHHTTLYNTMHHHTMQCIILLCIIILCNASYNYVLYNTMYYTVMYQWYIGIIPLCIITYLNILSYCLSVGKCITPVDVVFLFKENLYQFPKFFLLFDSNVLHQLARSPLDDQLELYSWIIFILFFPLCFSFFFRLNKKQRENIIFFDSFFVWQ